ncbi:MAG: hypothetical protein HYT80_09180 [Euryarchaeota archaeon]|nr:hypothetical protein [Euryarchaeota archaeon]
MKVHETTILILLAAILGASGCLGAEDPGGALPLEVANRLGAPVTVALEVREPYGNTILFESAREVAPGARERIETPRIPFGSYIVAATDGRLEREIETDFEPSTRFQRFVVHDQVIAFQSG